jgi:RNA polymerase sigma-70 factor, ECF subfamily
VTGLHSDEAKEADSLLRQAEEGDGTALNRLLDLHRPGLVRYVGVRLNPRLRARIDESDVVQETFSEVHRRIRGYLKDRKMPFGLWLRQIAYDRLTMEQRRHIRAGRRSVVREALVSDESSMNVFSLLPGSGSTPSRRIRQEELADSVRNAIGSLDDSDREIVLLRMTENMPFADIGLMLSMTEAAARKKFSRALDDLYDALVSRGWSDDERNS